jgi:hypothetical protein
MEIEVNGSKIQIIVRSLGDEMDTFLKKLFTLFFNEPSKPYNDFKEECFSDLEANIYLYFDSKIKNTLGQDFYLRTLLLFGNSTKKMDVLERHNNFGKTY